MSVDDGKTATEGLREEHRWILQVSGVLETILDREPDNGLDYEAIGECVDFIRLFADACHHGQEENVLFPELQAQGMPKQGGPIAVMLQEHEMGRYYMGKMKAALPGARGGDPEARKTLVNSGRGYVELIRAHIRKEDNVLFHMADRLVRGDACARVCERFDSVCNGVFEGKTKADLEATARGLIDRYGGG